MIDIAVLALALLVGFVLGAFIARRIAPPGYWDTKWTNWDDVPEHVKDEFRDELEGMRDSMNSMLDEFEKMIR